MRKEAKCRYLYIPNILYFSSQNILLPFFLPGNGLLLEFLKLLEYYYYLSNYQCIYISFLCLLLAQVY